MLHAGTMVQTGRALGIIIATGRQTALGELAASLMLPEPEPPLVRRMARFTNQLAVAMLFVIAVIAIIEAARGASLTELSHFAHCR